MLFVQGQLIGVALSFLRNFGIFSGASGVLGALSRGVAALGTDQAAQEVPPPVLSILECLPVEAQELSMLQGLESLASGHLDCHR